MDECHVVLTEMDYRETALGRYKRLAEFNCQLLLLTATLPPIEQNTMWDCFGIPAEKALVRRFPTRRCNLQYQAIPLVTTSSVDNKWEIFMTGLLDVIENHAILGTGERGIIFCHLIDDLNDYRQELSRSGLLGYISEVYHGKLTSEERSRSLQKWLTEPGWILATKGLGAGVDFPKLKYVVHIGFGRGDNLMEYAQQSGRAGRDNTQGSCFFLYPDVGGSRLDLTIRPQDGKEALLHFLYISNCRRKVLHGYLDADFRSCLLEEIPCDNCVKVIGMKKPTIPDNSGDLPSATQLFNMTRSNTPIRDHGAVGGTSQSWIPPSTSYSEGIDGNSFWENIACGMYIS